MLGTCVQYRIPSRDCDSSYINETGRTLQKRITEHKYAMKKTNDRKEWNRHAWDLCTVQNTYSRDCDSSYIDETGRTLQKRIIEYKYAVKTEKNGIAVHICYGTSIVDLLEQN